MSTLWKDTHPARSKHEIKRPLVPKFRLEPAIRRERLRVLKRTRIVRDSPYTLGIRMESSGKTRETAFTYNCPRKSRTPVG